MIRLVAVDINGMATELENRTHERLSRIGENAG